MKKHLLFLFFALLPLVASAETVEIDGIWYNLISKVKQAEVTSGGDYSGSITIPATVTHNGVEYSVTSIKDYAFQSCRSLTSIGIPKGVTSIGDWAFVDCSSLTAVQISSIEAWCKISFNGNYSNPLYYAHNLYLNEELVTELVIPESVTSIGESTFEGYSSLTSITLPEGVTSIGGEAFRDCSSLTAVTIPEGSRLTSIGSYAFYGCSSLTAINIPASMTSIGVCAFYDCRSLTAVTIPENSKMTSIGEWAFYGCSSLTAINIPEDVTSIGGYAFSGCSSLTAINIPKGVTSIETCIFEGCSSLTAINIPKGVTSIGDYAFSGCSSLTAINIPEGVTSIETKTFYECSSLTAINIPKGVTSIGNQAFRGGRSLTSISIPKGVTSIEYYAFANCSELTDVYCYAETMPSTSTDAFNDSYIEYATLHVPASSFNSYKTTAPWSSFGTIKTIENVTLEKCATPSISYIGGKVVLTCETEESKVITSISKGDDETREEMEFDYIPTYTITAYATKENYEDSDVATITLCWIPCNEEHKEGNGILTIPSHPVLISARDGVLTLSGLAENITVTLYTTDGAMVAHQQSSAGKAQFTLPTGQVYLVHIGDKVVKIGM